MNSNNEKIDTNDNQINIWYHLEKLLGSNELKKNFLEIFSGETHAKIKERLYDFLAPVRVTIHILRFW